MEPASAGLDALVVLGCKALGGVPSAALARRLERAWRANVDAHVPLVLMSGGKAWGDRREAEVMGEWWSRRASEGIAAESELVLELESQTTLQNALFSARLLRARSALRVGLVTCDYHMHRARKYFAARGLDVVAFPAPSARPWLERLRSFARERSALVIGRFERLPE